MGNERLDTEPTHICLIWCINNIYIFCACLFCFAIILNTSNMQTLISFINSIHKILKGGVCLCVSLNADAHMPWSVCRGQGMSTNVCLHPPSCLRQGLFGICWCICQIIWPMSIYSLEALAWLMRILLSNFLGFWEFELRSLCLQSKSFTYWVISPILRHFLLSLHNIHSMYFWLVIITHLIKW